MRRPLAVKFLVLLLATAALALTSAFVFRHLIIDDFRSFREGELEDRVYSVTARLEGDYDTQAGWRAGALNDPVVWALLLGLEVRVTDRAGRLLLDTATALGRLPEGARERVIAVSGYRPAEISGDFIPYPLFVAGQEVGRLEVRFLSHGREALFLQRANRFLLWSSVLVGGLAVLLSIVAARRLTRPLSQLADAAEAIGRGDLACRVAARPGDEIGRLGQTFNLMAENIERLEGLRRRLFANAAHELRTPLTAMRCEVEGMLDGLIPASSTQLQSILDEINRLAGFLQGMEDLSRAEASSLSLCSQQLELCHFLQGIAGRYRPLFEEKDVRLDLECAGEISVHADPERLSQIVVNLLGNAFQATPAGGRVRLSGEQRNSAVAIIIEDTGCGIADEEIPRIFERFYRGAQGGGMGIGLAIVKELVDAHGGRVEVESRIAEGSRFTVLLPNR